MSNESNVLNIRILEDRPVCHNDIDQKSSGRVNSWNNFIPHILDLRHDYVMNVLKNQPDFEELKSMLTAAYKEAEELMHKSEGEQEYTLENGCDILNYAYNQKIRSAIKESIRKNPIVP